MTRQAIIAAFLLACLTLVGCHYALAMTPEERTAADALAPDSIQSADSHILWRATNATYYVGFKGGYSSEADLQAAARRELARRSGSDEHEIQSILAGRPTVGMTHDQVRLAMGGTPSDVTSGGGAGYTWEAWHYHDLTIYFRNGQMVSWLKTDY